MKTYLLIILFIYIIKEAFEYAITYLNLKQMKKAGSSVPQEFKGRIDENFLKKAQSYELEKTGLDIVSSLFHNIIIILFIFGGLLNLYNSWIASLNLSFFISGWLFFTLLLYAEEALTLPFSLYNTFKIENKYGFNAMTLKLWVADFVKSFFISMILNSILIFSSLLIISLSPANWWLMLWGFISCYSIFIMYISPYIIEPLFNKFTPVDDELLKERIIRLAEKAGIHAGRILKIDASKRSRHTNAYFTGIGKTKRIVLYDTLLEGMSHDEIIAVLAHEIAHWKKKHLLKMMAAFEIFLLTALYISFRLIQSDLLLRVFDISRDSIFAKFLILGFLAGIIALPFKIIMNFFIRRHEREADRGSYEMTGNADGIISAFIKLSKENLSNLYPHPLYVSIYYSHPPILERIRYIKGLSKL